MISRLNLWITNQNWDQVSFLRYLLLIVLMIILMFIGWMAWLAASGLFEPEPFISSIRSLGVGFLYGAIGGILTGFIILIPKYLAKNWDLHEVVPYFLFLLLLLSSVLIVLSYFLPLDPILESGITIGFVVGGFIPILAYAGEVRREHSEELILIEDEPI